jgi:hypothetical protein
MTEGKSEFGMIRKKVFCYLRWRGTYDSWHRFITRCIHPNLRSNISDTMYPWPNANACGCEGDALFTKSDEAQLKGRCFNKSIGLFHKYYETYYFPRIAIYMTVKESSNSVCVFGWGTNVEMCKPTPFQSYILYVLCNSVSLYTYTSYYVTCAYRNRPQMHVLGPYT